MIKIYKPQDFDWMSYQITTNNRLTYHHILEECQGGLTTLENGALITKRAHRILNMLLEREVVLYDEWNILFEYINKMMQPPDEYAKDYSRTLKKHTQKIIYK